MTETSEIVYDIGDPVEKFQGEARYWGHVVSAYKTRRGGQRYVVEVEPQGFQMICTPGMLRLRPENYEPAPKAATAADDVPWWRRAIDGMSRLRRI